MNVWDPKLNFAGMVKKSVADLLTPGCYQGLCVCIDLTRPQGRWELVVLAVLLAARIDEAVAESTFSLLREAGLLEYYRVLRHNTSDVVRVQEILNAEYRGIIDRERKADAIFTNAAMLQEYDCDLNGMYQKLVIDSSAAKASAERDLVSAVRRLRQVNTRALWICRSMAEAGLWVNLGPDCTAYYDRHVRRALYRLGLLEDSSSAIESRNLAETIVSTFFAGDAIPLYRLGRRLCLPADLCACERHCEMRGHCTYWQKHVTIHSSGIDGKTGQE